MGLYLGAALLLFLLLPNQMYVYDLHCLSTDRDRPKILYKRIGRDNWFLSNQSEYSLFAAFILL